MEKTKTSDSFGKVDQMNNTFCVTKVVRRKDPMI